MAAKEVWGSEGGIIVGGGVFIREDHVCKLRF